MNGTDRTSCALRLACTTRTVHFVILTFAATIQAASFYSSVRWAPAGCQFDTCRQTSGPSVDETCRWVLANTAVYHYSPISVCLSVCLRPNTLFLLIAVEKAPIGLLLGCCLNHWRPVWENKAGYFFVLLLHKNQSNHCSIKTDYWSIR